MILSRSKIHTPTDTCPLPAAPTCASIANNERRGSKAAAAAAAAASSNSNGEVLRETPTTAVISVALGERIELACGMTANPRKGLEFRWTLNSSSAEEAGQRRDIAAEHFTERGARSLLIYTPRSAVDYGTLMCRASNEVGETTKEPCVYHVIPAGLCLGVALFFCPFCCDFFLFDAAASTALFGGA